MPLYTPESMLELLDSKHIKQALYHHKPVGSAEDDDNLPPMNGTVLKNLVLTNKKHDLVLFTLPIAWRANLKALSDALHMQRFSFGKADALEILGVPAGMVSPLALLNDTQKQFVYVQPAELDGIELVNCHPLRNNMSVDIKRLDLESLITGSGHTIVKLPGCVTMQQ